jgi:hypothetical protein
MPAEIFSFSPEHELSVCLVRSGGPSKDLYDYDRGLAKKISIVCSSDDSGIYLSTSALGNRHLPPSYEPYQSEHIPTNIPHRLEINGPKGNKTHIVARHIGSAIFKPQLN